MGGLCAGVVPSAPEIDIPAEDIAGAVTDAVKAIPETTANNIVEYKQEVEKCGDDDKFEVPDTDMVLTKNSSDEDIAQAAAANACATKARDAMKDSVWAVIEPKIDEQLDAIEPAVPAKMKNTAKDKFREKTTDPAVDKAVDEALEKAKNKEQEGN